MNFVHFVAKKKTPKMKITGSFCSNFNKNLCEELFEEFFDRIFKKNLRIF